MEKLGDPDPPTKVTAKTLTLGLPGRVRLRIVFALLSANNNYTDSNFQWIPCR